jgi:hypothetical protein
MQICKSDLQDPSPPKRINKIAPSQTAIYGLFWGSQVNYDTKYGKYAESRMLKSALARMTLPILRGRLRFYMYFSILIKQMRAADILCQRPSF